MQDTNTKAFRVAAVSTNTNGFGLHGYIMVAKDGEAWEVARSAYNSAYPKWATGTDIRVPGGINADGAWSPAWTSLGCETPKRLPNAPSEVRAELFKAA